jgi:hypothetical protein
MCFMLELAADLIVKYVRKSFNDVQYNTRNTLFFNNWFFFYDIQTSFFFLTLLDNAYHCLTRVAKSVDIDNGVFENELY